MPSLIVLGPVHKYEGDILIREVGVLDPDSGISHLSQTSFASENSTEGIIGLSTKIGMFIDTLKSIRQEGPHRKILVFSSFTTMLDKVKPFLDQEGFGTVACESKQFQTKSKLNNLNLDSKTWEPCHRGCEPHD